MKRLTSIPASIAREAARLPAGLTAKLKSAQRHDGLVRMPGFEVVGHGPEGVAAHWAGLDLQTPSGVLGMLMWTDASVQVRRNRPPTQLSVMQEMSPRYLAELGAQATIRVPSSLSQSARTTLMESAPLQLAAIDARDRKAHMALLAERSPAFLAQAAQADAALARLASRTALGQAVTDFGVYPVPMGGYYYALGGAVEQTGNDVAAGEADFIETAGGARLHMAVVSPGVFRRVFPGVGV